VVVDWIGVGLSRPSANRAATCTIGVGHSIRGLDSHRSRGFCRSLATWVDHINRPGPESRLAMGAVVDRRARPVLLLSGRISSYLANFVAAPAKDCCLCRDSHLLRPDCRRRSNRSPKPTTNCFTSCSRQYQIVADTILAPAVLAEPDAVREVDSFADSDAINLAKSIARSDAVAGTKSIASPDAVAGTKSIANTSGRPSCTDGLECDQVHQRQPKLHLQ
jgi:hypothetical protein